MFNFRKKKELIGSIAPIPPVIDTPYTLVCTNSAGATPCSWKLQHVPQRADYNFIGDDAYDSLMGFVAVEGWEWNRMDGYFYTSFYAKEPTLHEINFLLRPLTQELAKTKEECYRHYRYHKFTDFNKI